MPHLLQPISCFFQKKFNLSMFLICIYCNVNPLRFFDPRYYNKTECLWQKRSQKFRGSGIILNNYTRTSDFLSSFSLRFSDRGKMPRLRLIGCKIPQPHLIGYTVPEKQPSYNTTGLEKMSRPFPHFFYPIPKTVHYNLRLTHQ